MQINNRAKIIISNESDALLAVINDNEIADTVELADNVILDLDKEGNIVCVEILDLRDASIMDGVSSLNTKKIKLKFRC